MVHPTQIKAGDSCPLDIPEYHAFKMFLVWIFFHFAGDRAGSERANSSAGGSECV